MTDDVRAAYAESALAWRGAPERVYAALASALVDSSPVLLLGARVLDVGAGTGVGLRAAQAAGCADSVGVDLADTMLRLGGLTTRAVVGDVDHLPCANDAFDLAIASCVLSHVPRPDRTVTELLRVSGAVVASAFPEDWTHDAKAVVDSVAGQHGFVPPQWYLQLKTLGERRVGSTERLGVLAERAGCAKYDVRRLDVPTGLKTPTDLVRWRLGMAHLAPWLASLGAPQRAGLEAEATAALADAPELVVPLLVLTCQRSDPR